jgi:hypothetical protein
VPFVLYFYFFSILIFLNVGSEGSVAQTIIVEEGV